MVYQYRYSFFILLATVIMLHLAQAADITPIDTPKITLATEDTLDQAVQLYVNKHYSIDECNRLLQKTLHSTFSIDKLNYPLKITKAIDHRLNYLDQFSSIENNGNLHGLYESYYKLQAYKSNIKLTALTDNYQSVYVQKIKNALAVVLKRKKVINKKPAVFIVNFIIELEGNDPLQYGVTPGKDTEQTNTNPPISTTAVPHNSVANKAVNASFFGNLSTTTQELNTTSKMNNPAQVPK